MLLELECARGVCVWWCDAIRVCAFGGEMGEGRVSLQVAGRVCVFGSAMSQGCVFLKVRCEPVCALGSGMRAGCVGLDVCCGKGVCVWKWDARRVCVFGKLRFGNGVCLCM